MAGLDDHLPPIDKWCPGREYEGTVHLKQTGDEVTVNEDSVRNKCKVKITNRQPSDSLPDHKVVVRRVERIDDLSSDYDYNAEVIDDDIQQNIDRTQQDVDKRRKISDPFSNRCMNTMAELPNI